VFFFPFHQVDAYKFIQLIPLLRDMLVAHLNRHGFHVSSLLRICKDLSFEWNIGMVVSYIEALVPRRRIVQRFHADVRHIGAADALHREFSHGKRLASTAATETV
jgi:hypothetical protein